MSDAAAARSAASWSVAALLSAAGEALQTRLGACTVRGEISGYARAASGHVYFTLKDCDGAQAALRCAMFRRAAVLLDFTPADGQQVLLRGRVAVYEARGELQFIVEAMRAAGAGALYEEFLRLRARLATLGLFDEQRKRRIAAYPTAIGIVTSLDAAALHDVLVCLQRRAPQVSVVIYPSVVQGSEAPAALVRAVSLAGRRAEVDTLLVCRGGGSLADLWAFNDERVVHAIAASPIPVVVGVGHQTDLTLCDLAADVRAPTPTAAAEIAAPERQEAIAGLDAAAKRLVRQTRRRLDEHAQRLDRCALRLARPGLALGRQAQHLGHLDHRRVAAATQACAQARRRAGEAARRLELAGALRVERERARLDSLAHRLSAADPRRVLARGYAWVTDGEGRPLVSARQLHVGQDIQAVWADGQASATVVDVTPVMPSV